MASTRLIGIAGATCSGKTTLEKGLQMHYGGELDVLPFDDMCTPYDQLDAAVKNEWESPLHYDFERYAAYLATLKSGQSVSFEARSGQSYQEGIAQRHVTPRHLVVSAGFLALHDQRARDMFDLKIFIDFPEEEIEDRRVQRDNVTGQFDEQELRFYVRSHILPAHREYVVPQASYADIILDGLESREALLEQTIAALDVMKV